MAVIKLPEPFYFKNGKKAVILLHAYTGSSNDIRMMGRNLEREGYSVYAPHLSGHATSSPEDILKHSGEEWLEDVRNAVRFLQEEGFSQISILGLSLGGVLALKMIEEFPELIIGGGSFCSPVFLYEDNNLFPRFISYSKSVMRFNKVSENEIEERAKVIPELLEKQMNEIGQISKQLQSDLNKIKQPIFIAQAGNDELINPEAAYLLRDALTNTNVDFKWYPESTHVITVGQDRKELEKDVLVFLNQLPWNEE